MKKFIILIILVSVVLFGLYKCFKPADQNTSSVAQIDSLSAPESGQQTPISPNEDQVEDLNESEKMPVTDSPDLVDPKSDFSIKPIDPETDPANQV
ncbi:MULTISPECIES: hypothetical protein [unclassified Acinetobacter]|uniref:hypothetical protein n=1 Tax=unclassified Acinetobacter TaxID=196816 RepID=UPI00044E8F77|nr:MULTISPECIES: hypothetical protein [unclassified Acinetobacter]EZQ12389.1 hypothetical protein CL42_01285 [Acinetobacter sp. Ver3]